MKLSISQSELQNTLNVVSKGAATRSTLPVLAGILLRAEDGFLTMESTDLNLSIRSKVAALIEEEGNVVIPAVLLSNIVKKLPDAAVHLETTDDSVTILCESTSISLKTLPYQDFPAFPEVQPDQTISIPFALFSRMIKRVEKVVAHDETRPVLTGILIEANEETLRFVATDSYRLAITETSFKGISDFSAVIPGPFLKEVAGLTPSEEEISISFNENQIIVSYGTHTFINRRIEGTYPNYNQLLPDSFTTNVVFDTRQLIDSIDRISILSNKTTPVKIDVNEPSQTVQVSTGTQDVGAGSETIGATIKGESLEIAFNYAYVLDGLRAAESNEIILELQSTQRPGIFRVEGDETYLYLIMPVRIA